MVNNEETFKLIASDTKREIIRVLSKGQRTPSDLSRILGKSKSTVAEHLESLQNAGLVGKLEKPGRKWVFYTLTNDGQKIVSPRDNKIIFVLAITFLTFLGGLASIYTYMNPSFDYSSQERVMISVPKLESTGSGAANTVTNITSMFLYLSIVLFFTSVLGVLYIVKSQLNYNLLLD